MKTRLINKKKKTKESPNHRCIIIHIKLTRIDRQTILASRDQSREVATEQLTSRRLNKEQGINSCSPESNYEDDQTLIKCQKVPIDQSVLRVAIGSRAIVHDT